MRIRHRLPSVSSDFIFRFTGMSEQHAQSICEWRYEPPYDLFHFQPWETMKRTNIEFGDADIRARQYVSAFLDDGELAAYVQLFPLTGVTRLGMGLRPDLCGKGFGSILAREAALLAKSRRPHDEVDLEVHAWNTRAIKAYRKAGFEIADTYSKDTSAGATECCCMIFLDLLT